MTTVAAAIEETRRHLAGMHRAAWNALAAEAAAGATTLTFTHDLGLIAPGAYLGIGAEIVVVTATVPAQKKATVIRAMLGSTAATHATGAAVEVQPRFPRYAILDALRTEIRSWPPELYRTASATVSVGAGVRAVDLAGVEADIVGVLRARRQPRNTTHGTWPAVDATLERGVPTADFPSGLALFLVEAPSAAIDVHLTYARPFDTSTFVDATDLEADCGLAATMVDIPPLGAAARLVGTREAARTDSQAQGEYRRHTESPPDHAARAGLVLGREADRRIAEEMARLTRLWGPLR